MATAETKRRLTDLGVFLLPLVLMQASGMVLSHGGPRGVEASENDQEAAATAMTPLVPHEWSQAELDAAETVGALRAKPFGPAPLYYPEDEPEPMEVVEVEPEPDPPPEVVLQAILASSNSATALIDGKAHRVGDQIGQSGWVIVNIDPDLREVTIKDPTTDRSETIAVRRPG